VPKRKKNQKKEEEGELKPPFCRDLAMVPQKQQKKMKKGEQAPSLPNLGDDVFEATQRKKREQGPVLPRVDDGMAKATKKNEKRAPSLPRLGNGT